MYGKKAPFVSRVALTLAFVSRIAIVAPQPAHAEKFETLHEFTSGRDGHSPMAGVIADQSGNLYGTTAKGGASGAGTVFRVDKNGKEKVLYNFTGYDDGQGPAAALILDAKGDLYGTTYGGGNLPCSCGVVFKLDKQGKETVLYSFKRRGKDGQFPLAGLIRDSKGNLYGTTSAGGEGYGTVFKVDTGGRETVLYAFSGSSDGSVPESGLVRDVRGNLYGTTYGGGAYGYGVVFQVDAAGTETVLHSFTGGADGATPDDFGALATDGAGNLYGTAANGGDLNCNYDNPGCGVVFKLDTAGTETVLLSFTRSEGIDPYASVVRDAAGNLYGTTFYGGTYLNGDVFKLDTTGKLTVLHSFTGNADGGLPYGELFLDEKGAIYGTTSYGGKFNCHCGTVFKITP
jgi:uncharacterized repeat protein (TIGR03803 family)